IPVRVAADVLVKIALLAYERLRLLPLVGGNPAVSGDLLHGSLLCAVSYFYIGRAALNRACSGCLLRNSIVFRHNRIDEIWHGMRLLQDMSREEEYEKEKKYAKDVRRAPLRFYVVRMRRRTCAFSKTAATTK